MECTYLEIHLLFSLTMRTYALPQGQRSMGAMPPVLILANSTAPPSHPRADVFIQTTTLLVEVAHNVKSNNTGRK